MQLFIPFILIGILIGAGGYAMFDYFRRSGIRVAWYVWVLMIITFILLLLGINHVFGAFVENYPIAAWIGFIIFMVPALILAVVCWQLVRIQNK